MSFDNRIDDSKLSPCATTILNDLKRLNSGQLANVIQTFAGQSPTYNWNVQSGSLQSGMNAGTLSYDRSTHTVTTTFDTNKFSHATDLSVARTILHESIHAYIGAYFIADPNLFRASYPDLIMAYAIQTNISANDLQHDDMVKNWVRNIASSLEEYGKAKGYNLSSDYYNAMAWGGLEGTRAFQNLPNRNSIKEIILTELTGKDSSGNPATQQGSSSNCP